MQQTDIHQFLKRYFLANNCSIVTENTILSDGSIND